MPIPNQAGTVEIGCLIRVSVRPLGCQGPARIRTLKVGARGQKDYRSRPQVHEPDSEFVQPFLGRAIGCTAITTGSRGSAQELEYLITLEGILPPDAPIDPALVDSFEKPRALAA